MDSAHNGWRPEANLLPSVYLCGITIVSPTKEIEQTLQVALKKKTQDNTS